MVWDFWARYYDRLWVQKVSLEPTRRCIKNILKENKVNYGNILDIGCGTGQLLREIGQEFDFSLYTGIDFSQEMIAKAEEKEINDKNISKLECKNKELIWICASVEELQNLELPKFNAITCTHSIPYYKNQGKAVSDMADLLEKDGLLIIACASMNTLWDIVALSFVKFTTGLAHYPSIAKLKKMSGEKLKVLKIHKIKEKWYMPSIVAIVYRKI